MDVRGTKVDVRDTKVDTKAHLEAVCEVEVAVASLLRQWDGQVEERVEAVTVSGGYTQGAHTQGSYAQGGYTQGGTDT
eukprot:3399566-Pyramimonas_sp.AAC.1